MENVKKATLLKAEMDALRPINKEQEAKIMQKFRLDWNYHSNNLEGNSLTFGETKALILHRITAQGKPLKDHIEITGHDEAIKWMDDILKEHIPLTEHFIRQLHTLLLKESSEKKAITPDGLPTTRTISVGKYKTTPNHVKTKTGEIFYFASPEETPAQMNDLMDWYNLQKQNIDVNPIFLAAEFHYKFIRIHPFDDGNGRTARILMNFILMQYHYPPVIIKTEDKENYYSVLQQADAGIIEPFIEYIAVNLNRSLDIMIKGAKGENIDDENDIDKEIFLLEQKLKGIEKKGEIIKNRESILSIFDNLVTPTFNEFISSCKKLDQFYISHSYMMHIDGNGFQDGKGYQDNIRQITAKCRDRIKDDTKNITVQYSYKTFNKIGMGEFDFSTSITFRFNFTNYEIFNPLNFTSIIKMPYNEFLTKKQIKEIIDNEIKNHTSHIEKRIQKHQKK